MMPISGGSKEQTKAAKSGAKCQVLAFYSRGEEEEKKHFEDRESESGEGDKLVDR